MVRSKFGRRVVAAIAGTFLLLCQSAGVAHACTPDAPQWSVNVVHEACHDSAPDDGNTTNDDTCQPHCGSQQASTAQAKVNAPEAADLPVLTARLELPAFAAPCDSPVDYSLARAESPPLTIVHCRLRN
jgi:hypothetical protein